MSNSSNIQVRQIIANPTLTRNYRGQLAAALRSLERTDHFILACDYAEHVFWVYEEIIADDNTIRNAIHLFREFTYGRSSIHKVKQAGSALFERRYELLKTPPNHEIFGDSPYKRLLATETIKVAILAGRVCCNQQLIEAGYKVRAIRKLDASHVAFEASQTIALYAGGVNWSSEDKGLRTTARKQGHEASEKETMWQIQRLLDYVEEKISETSTSANDDKHS